MLNFYLEAELKAGECFASLYNLQSFTFINSAEEVDAIMSSDGVSSLKCR